MRLKRPMFILHALSLCLLKLKFNHDKRVITFVMHFNNSTHDKCRDQAVLPFQIDTHALRTSTRQSKKALGLRKNVNSEGIIAISNICIVFNFLRVKCIQRS